jgi:hypothetical protein
VLPETTPAATMYPEYNMVAAPPVSSARRFTTRPPANLYSRTGFFFTVRCNSDRTPSILPAMTASTAISAPTTTKKLRKRRISPKIVQAVELLAKGECRTQKQAAERVGVSEEWLSTMLGRDETRVLLEQTCRKFIRTGTVRATARLVELLDSASARTSLEAAKHVLGIENIRPPADGAPIVNIGLSVGYVIDLSGGPRDITPDADDRPSSAAPALSRGSGK